MDKQPQKRFEIHGQEEKDLKKMAMEQKLIFKRIRKPKDKSKRKFLVSFDKPQRLKDLKKKCENVDIMLAVNSKKFKFQYDSESFETNSASLQSDVHDVEHEILSIRQHYEKQVVQLKIDSQKKIQELQEYVDSLQKQLNIQNQQSPTKNYHMLLKKQQKMLQNNSIRNDQQQIIEIESDQEQIQNEKIVNNQEIQPIIQNNNEINQKSQEVQVDREKDLEEEEKYQKIGLIDKTIKKTPVKSNVESVNQLPGVEKFMKKQNQANEINNIKRFKKWELIQKQRQEAEFLRFQKLKEQNKK